MPFSSFLYEWNKWQWTQNLKSNFFTFRDGLVINYVRDALNLVLVSKNFQLYRQTTTTTRKWKGNYGSLEHSSRQSEWIRNKAWVTPVAFSVSLLPFHYICKRIKPRRNCWMLQQKDTMCWESRAFRGNIKHLCNRLSPAIMRFVFSDGSGQASSQTTRTIHTVWLTIEANVFGTNSRALVVS